MCKKVVNCDGCKHLRSGMTIDYVPGHYCNIGNNSYNCEEYDDKYTITDYFLDIFPNVIFLLALFGFAFLLCLAKSAV